MDIVIYIAIFLISAVVFTFVGIYVRKRTAESKIGSAEDEAKKIIEMAEKEAENKKKEEIFSAKEEIMNARKDLDEEIRERRGEIKQQEKRVIQKEENLEKKIDLADKKEKELLQKEQQLENRKSELDEIVDKQMQELQRISGLTKEDAKKQLLSDLEKTIVAEKAALIRELDAKTKEEADKNAKEILRLCYTKMCSRSYIRNYSINCITS